MTVAEAAKYTRRSPWTIRSAARSGELRGHQRSQGACWRFRDWELDAWLKGK
ncbi:helix-turn-helix domain-containing protein [Nocardia gipuzkoensis]